MFGLDLLFNFDESKPITYNKLVWVVGNASCEVKEKKVLCNISYFNFELNCFAWGQANV